MKIVFTIALCVFAYTCFAQTPEGYKTLGHSLDAANRLAPNRFTTFVGLDRDFAYSRFNRFLQDDAMRLTSDEKHWKVEPILGGDKKGEIAHYILMGDHVSLWRENQPNTYSITIEKGNIDFDYYTTFKITAPETP